MIINDIDTFKRELQADKLTPLLAEVDKYYVYPHESNPLRAIPNWHDKFVKPLYEKIQAIENDYDAALGGTVSTFSIGSNIVEGHITATGKVYLLYSGADSGGYDIGENITVYDNVKEFLDDCDLGSLIELIRKNI